MIWLRQKKYILVEYFEETFTFEQTRPIITATKATTMSTRIHTASQMNK